MLSRLLDEILLEESVSVDDVNNAIDGHNRVIIEYHSDGKDEATGARVIEVYAYGLTAAGNPVIRAFQPYGDTTSSVPSWKMFRLDRIDSWRPTKQVFSKPASEYYNAIGDYNENGDKTMSIVYKNAKFGDENIVDNSPQQSSPKMKTDVFKTGSENSMERLRQQLDNPITLDDLKTKNAFPENDNEKTQSGPKLKDDVFKTDTERGLERLRQQLENPRMLDDLKDKNVQPEEDSEEAQTDAETADNTFKTDSERGLERLRQQLENPRMIDLSKIPKR